MKISRERLEKTVAGTGFRIEILEKVIHLMMLLNDIAEDDYLSDRIALKGGTALNLFTYHCPRLSVDIDLNYIGSSDRTIMLSERAEMIRRIELLCEIKDYVFQHKPDQHAGGKWIMRYQSDLKGSPRLEVDLNFLTRVPLFGVHRQSSIRLGAYQVDNFPILDKHELAGGKLKALFSRHSSRDLFDTYYLLQDETFDIEKLKIAFIVYGGMSRIDWRSIQVENIQYTWAEFNNMLLPMLRRKEFEAFYSPRAWAENILNSTQEKLSQLLPLQEKEHAFLHDLLDKGEISPEYLTQDTTLQDKIRIQPGLLWKAYNVRAHLKKN